MNLIELRAENFMGLKAVRVRPNGPVTRIVGENQAGKTSVLDAISAALGGGNYNPDLPIHKGKTSAKVIADLGDMVVTRKWSAKGGTSLEITGKDGAKLASPQKVLDNLMGRLSFDPLEFSRMKPTEQAATLAKIAGYDLDKHAVEKQQIFAERTVVNRKAKEAASQLAGMQPVPPETPDVEESVTAIVEELNAAQEHNQRVRSARAAVETAEREERELRERFERSRDVPAELINQRDREIERIKADFAAKIETAKDASNRLGLKLDEYVAKVVSTKAAADSLTMMETAGLQERATKAEGVNRNVWAKRNRAAKKAEVEELERKGEELTAKLEALEAAKAKTIASTEFPIDGLDVSESGVCIDGIPFAQCSGAQRLKTSVAIGLALNPTLKLMLIRDGSLLDESSMGMLADMAAAANAQVLIERVANAGEVGVRIVDGETVDDAAEAKVAA